MTHRDVSQEAVLRIGEVVEVSGRKIYVRVSKNKNLSDFFYAGDFIRNVSVNGFVEIRKGFLRLIGRVEGERVEEAERGANANSHFDKNKRTLTVALVGFVDKSGVFFGGTRELPLIGNEAFLVTSNRIQQIHQLSKPGVPVVTFARTEGEDYPIKFPVDGLFNSHIAIFGNTGSGKSNTLAAMFGSFVHVMRKRNLEAFTQKCRFLLIDFNGEYVGEHCITQHKKVYNLSTRHDRGDKLPIDERTILDAELIAILCDATEKTQKPFLRRAIKFYQYVFRPNAEDPRRHFQNILRTRIHAVLQMSDKVGVDLLFDYLREILPKENAEGEEIDIASDLEWHNKVSEFKLKNQDAFLKSNPEFRERTVLFGRVEQFNFGPDLLSRLVVFMYLQLISDVLSNRAQNEHIAPVINRLKSKHNDIERLIDSSGDGNIWDGNFVVVNLNDVNLDMKKTIPLLLSRKEYLGKKALPPDHSLNLIIDEAHNILSTVSNREAESWKDYRLETFEEIIKEGRKFGVFVTISSQRPNDISATIVSQAHNYFVHRLINQKDLATISTAVSYIDELSEASIPALPTGTCIFSGTAGQMPLKLKIDRLLDAARPQSGTLEFGSTVPQH